MNVKKITIISFLVLFAIGVLYFLFKKPQNSIFEGSDSGPSFPKEGYFRIGAKEENRIIYQKIQTALRSAPQSGAPGVYAVTSPPAGTPPSVASEYSIIFFEDKTAFTIIINARPLSETRTKAERALLEKLGITKEEACHLNVDLGVIASVDIDMSGRNFGLSFCPNGIPFPPEEQ